MIVKKIKKIKFTTLIFFFITLLFTNIFQLTHVLADDLIKLRNEHAKILRQTEANWIEWRFMEKDPVNPEKFIFYTSHLITYRCGIDEAFWGVSKDKIEIDMEIGKPLKNSGSVREQKIAKMNYETNVNGCDPIDPYSTRSLKTYEILDDKSIKSIWVKIKLADKKKYIVSEFQVSKKVLRDLELSKNIE